MLIELWEHFRGYDKWIETDAKVESAKLVEVDLYGNKLRHKKKQGNRFGWRSECQISWLDEKGNRREGSLAADEESSLYQLCEGDTFKVRFDPKNSACFYARGLLESNVTRARKRVVWSVVMALGAVVVFAPEIIQLLSRLSNSK